MLPAHDPEELPPPQPAPAVEAEKKTHPLPAPHALTPEEQMEKFAEELKEQDWGHQPC